MSRLPAADVAGSPDAFPPADAFAASPAHYATTLPVVEGVAVTALRRDMKTGRFRVASGAGDFVARSVVIASGAQRVPQTPVVTTAIPRKVEQLHAAA